MVKLQLSEQEIVDINEALDDHIKGKVKLKKPSGKAPNHIAFI